MAEWFLNKGYSRQIFFEGDSLSNFGGSPNAFGYRMPQTAYSNLTDTKPSMQCYAIQSSVIQSGQALSIYDRASQILDNANANDIVVIWAGTNDMSVNLRTANQIYTDLVSYAVLMRNAGLKVVAVTTIAKDRVGDDTAAINVTRLAYNSLILGGSSFVFDAYADPAALTQFDTVADASNATYYVTGGVHLTDTGYDLVAGTVTTAIQSLL